MNMMKRTILLLLISSIHIDVLHAGYPAQKCYVCDTKDCAPTDNDIKSCSESATDGTSGKPFVGGAFNTTDDINTRMTTSLTAFGTTTLGINQSVMPSWSALTRWACYVSEDKRRGCLVMGKGLCDKDKTVLGQITSVGDKFISILNKAKKSVTQMFSDSSIAPGLSDAHKLNISEWIASNYYSVLVKNNEGPEYRLHTCCEGDVCNAAVSMERSSMASVLLVAFTLSVV